MKKIIEKMEAAGIRYEKNNYGNAQYFNDDFSVPGIVVTVSNYGIEENAPEVVKSILKAARHSKKYAVIDSSQYGIEAYRIHLAAGMIAPPAPRLNTLFLAQFITFYLLVNSLLDKSA